MIGLAATAGLLLWVMFAGAGYAVDVFWRTPSLALVVGGSVLVTIAAVPRGQIRRIGPLLREAFVDNSRPPTDYVSILVAMADIARRDGLLALERTVKGLDESFLQRTLMMAIDGAETGDIETVMRTELESTDLRHTEGKNVLESMGHSAPVFGMIGTLIGLVIMFGGMEDPASIGPGMAIALLTTLYGLIFAHVFCLPLARKLDRRNSQELLGKTLILQGVLAIQRGDHPRIVEQKLRAYLPSGGRGYVFTRSTDRKMKSETDRGEEATAEKRMQQTPRSKGKSRSPTAGGGHKKFEEAA
jgi:chemotaxis protein MotA